MSTTATPTAIPAGYRADAMGRLVPEAMIPDATLIRDDLVRRLIDRARETSASLARTKAALLADIAEHVALVASAYDTQITGQRGDVRLDSFDGTLRIERASGNRTVVGEQIHAAEALVREYLDSASLPDGVRAIVDRTFRRNRKTGELSVSRLVDFVSVEIDDDRWRMAQRAIREALQAAETVTYFRAYERARPDLPWQQIPLDFSAVQPLADAAREAQ